MKKNDNKQTERINCYVTKDELKKIKSYIKRLKFQPSLSELVRASILSEIEGEG